jgi:hypothetical protein
MRFREREARSAIASALHVIIALYDAYIKVGGWKSDRSLASIAASSAIPHIPCFFGLFQHLITDRITEFQYSSVRFSSGE